MSFYEILKQYNWQEITDRIENKNTNDVILAINKENLNIEDFMALVSPAASSYLEQMAVKSQALTQKRFGKTIQLYIPLYLSNECTNQCVYCGFGSNNKIERVTLNEKQILDEIEVIKSYGYEHLLLVTGEHPKKAGFDYLKMVIDLLKTHFSLISLEVQPLETDEYKQLVYSGLNTVYIYQETYNEQNYPNYHLAGKKRDFKYRLETPERLGKAGIYKIGLGNLIGLENWRTEAFFTVLHLQYLKKNYWKTKYSLSFPRLRPHQGNFKPNVVMTDKQLVQLICAYRLFDENLELSLSTRENKAFRDNAFKLGITSMSAGSKTEPGGYANSCSELEQFAVDDTRTAAQIAEMISKHGYQPVWKDWDSFMQKAI